MSAYFVAKYGNNALTVREVKCGQMIPEVGDAMPREHRRSGEEVPLVIAVFRPGSHGAILCDLVNAAQGMCGHRADVWEHLEDMLQTVLAAQLQRQ